MTNVWPQHSASISGAWKLLTFTMIDTATGNIIGKPHDNSPQGRVVFTPGAFMFAQMSIPASMRAENENVNANYKGTKLTGINMYCGHFEVVELEEGDAEGDGDLLLRTTPVIASEESMLAVQERWVRRWQEDGREIMRLRPRGGLKWGDAKARAELTWERFEAFEAGV